MNTNILAFRTVTAAWYLENAVAETITDEQIVQFDRVLNGLDWGYYPDPWAF